MGAVQTPAEGLTFEKVWAALMENREQMRETAERFKETERLFKETAERFRETDKKFQETDKKISRLGNRIGDLIEHFAAGNILGKFRDLGFTFNLISRNMIIEDGSRRSLAEVDLYLENGEDIMIVEVKTNLTRYDVDEHLARMDKLRSWADSRGDRRNYLGAIAAAFAGEGAREYALSSGFFLVEQQGDNVRITAPERRRVW
jgi:hypothetical protein